MRHFRSRAVGAFAGAVAVTVLAAACSSSPSSSSSSGASSGSPSTSGASAPAGSSQFNGLNPGTGAPKYGGTLNEIGVSDVDVMDYDVGYYSLDYQQLRLTVRQLYGWAANPVPGGTTTPEPDLATGMPVVSADGKTVSVTIRDGVMWNTTPARAVTAADVVRGIKRACNNSPHSFGGMVDFESTIVGLSAFCAGYPKAAATSATALKSYVEGHNVSGITTSGSTIMFKLTQPAAWLVGAMTLPPFSAVPIEAEIGLPGSPAVYSHMYSDGPYQMTSYVPAKSIKFVRNPVWKAADDPLRKAYVDAINIDETGNQTTIYQQITTNSPSLGMTWDSLTPPSAIPQFYAEYQQKNPDVNLGSTYSTNPYMVFNTISPNNGAALGTVKVRQALEYALDRTQLIKQIGAAYVNTPLTHVLPAGIDGSQDLPANYDPYPYNTATAKSMLSAAGFTSSHPLTLKFLYRSDSQGQTKLFNNIQAQLGTLGDVNVVGVPTNQADFYGKYLTNTTSPTPAKQGVWDIALAGWGPDWYGNSATSFFLPLYSSPGGFPPNGGSNFGYFSDPTVNSDITQALAQTTESAADQFWAKADQAVMAAAAFYPITDPLELDVHASYVHNAVFMPAFQQYDAANVWLSNS